VEGRRLNFRIEAWDATERIGEADHERCIIDAARFQKRVAVKSMGV
jgi:fluoroacetyl-CoA thioesterase